MNAEAEGKGPDALRLAINPLADMMPEETPLGLIPDEADVQKGRRRLVSGDEDSYRMLSHKAVTVDHHFDGHMVPVKDQGLCGSCWAFASNSALEAAIAIKYDRTPVHLSEQHLVDCTKDNSSYRTWGCDGGWMNTGWRYQ